MAKAMRRRGPDGMNFWLGGNIGMGHCTMWTTPEALYENPPLLSADGNRVLSADVRLDNRAELLGSLRTYLPANQRPSLEIGDHEIILAAYEKWGKDCPEHLLGDFAFVIWDESIQSAFCARDHFGSKPFHYFNSDGLFVCASEVKGILEVKDVPVRINEPRIADFLVEELEGIDKTSTFYQDIFRLPPATTMLVDRNCMRHQRYWQLNPDKSLNLKSQAEYTEAFLEVFKKAVDCRLRSHKPPASMLSGGIDSSAIVAVGRDLRVNQGLEPLHTISALSDTPDNCIESQAALAVINQGNVIAHIITPSEIPRFRSQLEEFVYACDDPFSLPGMGVPLAVYCRAEEEDINVVLDGIDGDLATSHGPHYLAYLLKESQWTKAFREARSLSQNTYRGTISPLSLLFRNARTAYVPHHLRKHLHKFRAYQRLKGSISNSVINPEFAREANLTGRLERLYAYFKEPVPPTLRKGHATLLDQGFITAALERYDRQATSRSIEARHPYFDVRLMEYCLSLPWHQRISNGYSKTILRSSMENHLPESVSWRVGGWEHLGPEFHHQWKKMQSTILDQDIALQQSILNRFVRPDMLTDIQRSSERAGKATNLSDQAHLVGTLALWLARQPPAAV